MRCYEGRENEGRDGARGIDGAKEVKNLLQVVPGYKRAVVNRSDDAIKSSVEAAFKANRRVNDSRIKVESKWPLPSLGY